ncbi:hypothetical protein TRFO_07357 [Tritrichomonas foetus]|uniref:Raptor N-terminal CASPase-like domain-containing protein n=1 Tax=Tritrichomonas foetus TaxID=1144522 RepID=A0A1J4JWA2_9EUKA|nr:hypothetical protein TRFO_07357 [Tritrichomonas foetus]|eukprot:OHT01806.1 hypothetical protein TRFO_07357 [Tritrichomonas foetus]
MSYSKFYISMNSGTDNDDTVPDNIECAKGQRSSPSHYFDENFINTDILFPKKIKNPLPFSDQDFALNKLNKPFIPDQIPSVIPPETIMINFANIKNFPKFIKTTLYAWHDATGESQQAFNATLIKYFRSNLSQTNPNLRYIPLGGQKDIHVEDVSKLRKEISSGRLIFHYIGYGFPQLTAETLYLSGGVPTSPRALFKALSTPSFYIFDCDNAGIMIPVFQSMAAPRQRKPRGVGRLNGNQIDRKKFRSYHFILNRVSLNDYFILCATSPGEELPRDPTLPRDFLTSVLLSPVQTAILCHFYLTYRTSLNFNELNPSTINELEQLLDIIVDGIACECLPGPSLQLLLRNNDVMHTLFRNFILAQFILKPFGVHPVSHPPIPDMSGHQLWEQWKAAVDNSIGTFATGRNVIKDYFDRALLSFKYFYVRRAFSSITPSLLSTIIWSKYYKGAAKLIYDYPKSIETFTNIIIFPDLFSNLTKLKPRNQSFNDLCYVILAIFKYNLNVAYQIPNDFNWEVLITFLYDKSIFLKTRILIAAILATCAPHNKSLRQICTTAEFIKKLQSEMVSTPPLLFSWSLILFKRVYDIFAADPSVFMPTGFHIQCAVCCFHYSQRCRSAAISNLSCFMQGNDMQFNVSLLIYALPMYNDMSYFVRHQLVMLIQRYLTTHQDDIEQTQPLKKPRCSSFNLLTKKYVVFPDLNNISDYFKLLEDHKTENFKTQYINDMMQFFITYFSLDPHPAIAAEAASAREYFFRGWKKDNEDDDDDYIPFESDSDALYQISIQQTLENVVKTSGIRSRLSFSNDNWSKHSGISLKVECPLSAQPKAICFDSLSTGVVIGLNNDIVFYDDKLKVRWSMRLGPSSTTDIKVTSWFNESLAIVTRANGCGYICKAGNKKPITCWRADANVVNSNIPLYTTTANDRPCFATVRGSNHSVLWDMSTLKMVQETPNMQQGALAKSIALHPSNSNLMMVGYDNGFASICDLRSNQTVNTISVLGNTNSGTQRLSGSAGSGPSSILAANNLNNDSIPSIVKVIGNVAENSTFYITADNGKCIKWSPAKRAEVNVTSGSELFDFDAHQILPMLAFTPKNLNDQIILNESRKGIQKIKMEAGSRCVFHPTQPICAFASAHELKIFRL